MYILKTLWMTGKVWWRSISLKLYFPSAVTKITTISPCELNSNLYWFSVSSVRKIRWKEGLWSPEGFFKLHRFLLLYKWHFWPVEVILHKSHFLETSRSCHLWEIQQFCVCLLGCVFFFNLTDARMSAQWGAMGYNVQRPASVWMVESATTSAVPASVSQGTAASTVKPGSAPREFMASNVIKSVPATCPTPGGRLCTLCPALFFLNSTEKSKHNVKRFRYFLIVQILACKLKQLKTCIWYSLTTMRKKTPTRKMLWFFYLQAFLIIIFTAVFDLWPMK